MEITCHITLNRFVLDHSKCERSNAPSQTIKGLGECIYITAALFVLRYQLLDTNKMTKRYQCLGTLGPKRILPIFLIWVLPRYFVNPHVSLIRTKLLVTGVCG